MRRKLIVVVLLGAILEGAWLMGAMQLLRGTMGSGPLGRLAQEVTQVKTLIGKAGDALKVDQTALEKALKELRGELSPSPSDPSRDPFALPQGVRLLSELSGAINPTAVGEVGTEKSAQKDGGKAAAAEPRARQLSGILVGPRDRVAIIDGTLVRPGDSHDGEQVIDIQRDHVVLARDGQRRTLRLPPPFPESGQWAQQVEIRVSTGEGQRNIPTE